MSRIRGTDGSDRLSGTGADDSIAGRLGDDILAGRGGDDDIAGGDGDDVLIGSQGMDTLRGGVGNDKLRGGTESQESGFVGAIDTLDGGRGNDRIGGGFDFDFLTGGAGRDRFTYKAVSDSTVNRSDTISDFVSQVDKLVFRGELTEVSDLSFIGRNEFSGVAGEVRFDARNGASAVMLDVDGDGVADLRIDFSSEIEFQLHDFVF